MNPGDKFKLFFSRGNPNNGRIEIRAIVDDFQVIFLFNGKYQMESIGLFKMYSNSGYLKPST